MGRKKKYIEMFSSFTEPFNYIYYAAQHLKFTFPVHDVVYYHCLRWQSATMPTTESNSCISWTIHYYNYEAAVHRQKRWLSILNT